MTAQQQGEGCVDLGCGSKGVVRIDLATMEVMGSGCCARATAMVVQIGKR